MLIFIIIDDLTRKIKYMNTLSAVLQELHYLLYYKWCELYMENFKKSRV